MTEAQVIAFIVGGSEYGGNSNGTYANTYQTAPVTVSSMSQSGNGQIGNNSLQTVSVTYTSPLGYGDIGSGEIFIGPGPSASTSNGCYVQWFTNNTFVLYNGASSYTGTGGGGQLNGAYCSLLLWETSVVTSSSGVTVTLGLLYNAAMGNSDGSVNSDPVWANGMNNEGWATGWINMGSVSVSQYDVSVTVSGSPVALTYHSTATITVNYQGLNGYSGAIYFDQPTMQAPGCVSPSLSSTSAGGSGAITLTFTYNGYQYTGSSAAFLGSFTAYIPGGPEHTIWFEVDVVSASTFTITPEPPVSQSVGASGSVSYQLLVPDNGFISQVNFTGVSGLPSSVGFNFSPSGLYAGQVSALTLTANPGTPPGTYTATISAVSGGATATTTVTLIVTGPATLSVPASGTYLPGGSTAFAWAAVPGATEYQLLLGSSNGSSNYYSGPLTTTTSAVGTFPAGNYTLMASLGTLTGGSWQWTYSSYTVSTQVNFTPPVLTAGQPSAIVPMNNVPVLQTLTFAQGDPRTVYDCEPVDDVAFRVRIISATATTLTLSYQATAQALPSEPIGCTCPGGPFEPPAPTPVPPPKPSLIVTSNGQTVAQVTPPPPPSPSSPVPPATAWGSCNPNHALFIDNTPAMPPLQVTIVMSDGSRPTGTATFSVSGSFPETNLNTHYPPNGTFLIPWGYWNGLPSVSQPTPQSANDTWTAGWSTPVGGGNASIQWDYNGAPQQPFNFCILGKNPDPSAVTAALSSSNPYWFANDIAIHETEQSQFCDVDNPTRTSGSKYCQDGGSHNRADLMLDGRYGESLSDMAQCKWTRHSACLQSGTGDKTCRMVSRICTHWLGTPLIPPAIPAMGSGTAKCTNGIVRITSVNCSTRSHF